MRGEVEGRGGGQIGKGRGPMGEMGGGGGQRDGYGGGGGGTYPYVLLLQEAGEGDPDRGAEGKGM